MLGSTQGILASAMASVASSPPQNATTRADMAERDYGDDGPDDVFDYLDDDGQDANENVDNPAEPFVAAEA